MPRKAAILLLLCLVLPETGAALIQDLPNQGALERVVILSRHGVRSPTQNTETLNSWRQPPPTPAWPGFGVPPGHLTPKGQALIQEMGASYRTYFDKNRLFDPAQCPDKVFIWADQDQRTLVTAQDLGIGLTREKQNCPFEISKATEKIDPVFHPTEALPPCHLDPDKVREEVRDPDKLKDTYRSQLDKANEILQCCSARLCESSCNGLGDQNCTLQTLPSCADAANGQASIKGGPFPGSPGVGRRLC
jgi:4-phytase / acid phosphatase